MGVFSGQ